MNRSMKIYLRMMAPVGGSFGGGRVDWMDGKVQVEVKWFGPSEDERLMEFLNLVESIHHLRPPCGALGESKVEMEGERVVVSVTWVLP